MPITLRRLKYNFLIKSGMNHLEATEFSRQYSVKQLRSVSYISAMLRWRRLYVAKLKSLKYTDRNIQGAIANLYYKHKWQDDNGKFDPWKMLKRFRKDAIVAGDYVPPVKKGSHHPANISKGDVQSQRLRARTKEKTGAKAISGTVQSVLDKIQVINQQIAKEPNDTKKDVLIVQRNLLWDSIK